MKAINQETQLKNFKKYFSLDNMIRFGYIMANIIGPP